MKKLKRLNLVGKNSKSVLIDKWIIDLLNINTFVTLEVINNQIILTPYYEKEV